MIVVIPFHPGDQAQALAFALWLEELGGAKWHELILIRDTRCSQDFTVELIAEFTKSFDHTECIDYVDHYRKWPESPNEIFGMAARHIASTRKQPWMFCEPDAVLLTMGAFDQLWAEYQLALKNGKHFTGDLVTAGNSGVNVIPHCSGNAVYPANLYEHAGNVFLAGDVAFDVAAADQIVPQMQTSELIRHSWRAPAFANWEDVQARIFAVKPKAVLFHADKTGSLYPLLRARRNPLPVPSVLAEEAIAEANGPEAREAQRIRPFGSNVTARGGQFICDIFIKTYPKDYPWLEYCLRSIDKFASGFRELAIVHPDGEHVSVSTPNISWRRYPKPEYGPNGYLSQQVFKLYADEFTDAEYICYTDSDTIFTKPVTPEMFFTDGKLNWMISPHSTVETPWQAGAEKFLKSTVKFEFMRRFPLLAPRWLLAEVREFCRNEHGMSLSEYVMAQEPPEPPVSEFNLIGAYAYIVYPDKFNWIDTSVVPESEWPELVVRQAYSHDGITDAIREEFETILSGDNAFVAVDNPKRYAISESTATSPATLIETGYREQIPWANREESIAEISRLAGRLKQFQGKSAPKVRFVRELLQRQGVIELPYRNRKRKGWRRKKK